ncbi:IclR family transcriptional regulator [Boseongicola aestuarii]|uniref:Glycerol operon regulatory protein n=1 Tax=Boseongicola aestuarii TaxID=1470561 RepID=A0A238IVS4_9RHOB|nr:IclR family transcriptional regulator C-terminal domain-containing protein [Boseongicola aestuarii]SMX21995.1 Glycerol operon regulatory protein [Boseongicola aestuarii]
MHLERLTMILEIIGHKGEATVADIVVQSGLPTPSAYRLVKDLVGVGLIDPTSKGRFSVGTRLKQITATDRSDVALVDLIAPTLKQAANEYRVAFFLSRLKAQAVEIIHVETPEIGVSYLHPGLGKRPLHACSCSKAVLAFNTGLELPKDLEGRLKAYTDFTLTNVSDLEAELEMIRQRGFAECVEEMERGMCSVASPLGKTGFGATLSVGATGSMRVFTKEFRARIGAQLTELAEKLSTSFDTEKPREAHEKSGT